MAEQPLFPLRTVLFPDGLLELKIFEARYLDLMSRCLGEQVQLYEVGTLAELIDVDSAQAGILLVRCRGTRRFVVGATRQERDGLWMADTTPIADDRTAAPTASHAHVVKSLADAIATLAAQGAEPFLAPHRLDDAGWVANRWCEILPLPLEAKQRLMTLEDPVARLEVVDSLMRVRHQKQ